MKTGFIILLILWSSLLKAQNPYSVSFQSIDGQTINMSDYAGKKILVLVINASTPDTAQLQIADSIYQADDSILSVIGLPVDDFGTPLDDSTLSSFLEGSLGLHYIIGETGSAGKSSDNQQLLLKWLTHVSANSHFDNDITQDYGQMYLINETGTLFGLFNKETPLLFLDGAIKQTFTN